MQVPIRPALLRACSASGTCTWALAHPRPNTRSTHNPAPAAAAAAAYRRSESSMGEQVLWTVHSQGPAEKQLLADRFIAEEFSDNVHFSWPDGKTAPHKQQPSPPSPPIPLSSFNGSLYMSHLTSKSMGKVLLATQEVGSTQDFMRANHSRLPTGTVVTAERQVSGRGRGGNQWTSPAGCLMFTASRPLSIPGSQAPFINYVVCLGVLRGIRDAVEITSPGAPDLNIKIKWPNDLYYVPHQQNQQKGQVGTPQGLGVGALKIGGALMHTTWQSNRFNLLVGIGLNLSNRQPTTCIQALLEEVLAVDSVTTGVEKVSVGTETGSTDEQAASAVPEVKPEVLLARVISHLDYCLEVFEAQGFAPLEADYLAAWMHSGQRVMFEKDAEQSVTAVRTGPDGVAVSVEDSSITRSDPVVHGGGAGGEKELVALRIQGLSGSGFLLAVEEGTGRQYELTPDGNSLDMLAGLIRRKIT